MNLVGGPSPTTDGASSRRPERSCLAARRGNRLGAGLLLVLAALGVIVLARLWMRRTAAHRGRRPGETRTIDQGGERPRFGRRGRRRPLAPVDAVTAYKALIADLADRPGVRREPAETPSEHAHRLRADGASDLRLDLLAADYALARFAGVTLSSREDRRALESLADPAPAPGPPQVTTLDGLPDEASPGLCN